MWAIIFKEKSNFSIEINSGCFCELFAQRLNWHLAGFSGKSLQIKWIARIECEHSKEVFSLRTGVQWIGNTGQLVQYSASASASAMCNCNRATGFHAIPKYYSWMQLPILPQSNAKEVLENTVHHRIRSSDRLREKKCVMHGVSIYT